MNKRIIELTLNSVNGSTILEKLIKDFNKGKRSYQTKETLDKLAICLSIFLNNQHLRTHSFGNTKKENRIRSEERAELLINTDQYRSAMVRLNNGGALKSNGLIISVSGFGNEQRNEYASWLILSTIERRLNEIEQSLGDLRFKEIENNIYIVEEKNRLKLLN